MPTLAEIIERRKKEKALLEPQIPIETNMPLEAIPELEILPMKNIKIEKKARISNIVGYEYDTIPIDFTALANSSEFKRLIFRAIVGKVHRGNDKTLEVKLSKFLKKLKGSEK